MKDWALNVYRKAVFRYDVCCFVEEGFQLLTSEHEVYHGWRAVVATHRPSMDLKAAGLTASIKKMLSKRGTKQFSTWKRKRLPRCTGQSFEWLPCAEFWNLVPENFSEKPGQIENRQWQLACCFLWQRMLSISCRFSLQEPLRFLSNRLKFCVLVRPSMPLVWFVVLTFSLDGRYLSQFQVIVEPTWRCARKIWNWAFQTIPCRFQDVVMFDT